MFADLEMNCLCEVRNKSLQPLRRTGYEALFWWITVLGKITRKASINWQTSFQQENTEKVIRRTSYKEDGKREKFIVSENKLRIVSISRASRVLVP